jgi:hypothetical protein
MAKHLRQAGDAGGVKPDLVRRLQQSGSLLMGAGELALDCLTGSLQLDEVGEATANIGLFDLAQPRRPPIQGPRKPLDPSRHGGSNCTLIFHDMASLPGKHFLLCLSA